MTSVSTVAPRIADQAHEQALLAGRRRARLTETLLGLLFVAPAAIIAFIFELFPVAYGFYISLQGGSGAVPEGFDGLDNFVKAVGGLAYMVALAIALVFAIGGYLLYRRALLAMREGGGFFYTYLIPGFIAGPATLAFFGLAFRLGVNTVAVPVIALLFAGGLYIRLRLQRGEHYDSSNLLYMLCSWGVGLLTTSTVLLTLFTFSEMHRYVQPVHDIVAQLADRRVSYIFPLFQQILALGGIVAGVVAIFTIHHARRQVDPTATPRLYSWLGVLRLLVLAAVAGFVLYVLGAQDALRTTLASIESLTAEQIRAVTRLRLPALLDRATLWMHVFTMLLGIGLLGVAAYLWWSTRRSETTVNMLGTLFIAICLMVGGWALIGELPTAASAGDPRFYQSLLRTVTYAIMTVPVQLGIGLFLAYLLFYEVTRGKSFYRLVFFIPYVAPVVATAAVFAMIFSNSTLAPMNQFLQGVGLPAQQWLRNPKGIFQILAEIIGGPNTVLPPFLVGPSLPLFSAILYAIWVFSGYNAVVFMAGLGTVPKEIYEAAQVDGANRWETFRSIIFPLISPTTFFLTMLAITGTFRAFTHIWVLRDEAARGAMDTTMIYIFETIQTPNVVYSRPYAAAMSFLLFGIILILTIIQNRISRDRVFYG